MRHRRSAGFTLTELLIVIALILIFALIALPAFDLLTGQGSKEAGRNLISAALGRAREEAMALRQGRAVLFSIDPATKRTAMDFIYHSQPNVAPTARVATVPDTDRQLLPAGIGVRFVAAPLRSSGVIAFDGFGELYVAKYDVAPAPGGLAVLTDLLPTELAGNSELGLMVYDAHRFADQPDADKQAWLEENAEYLLVNRYNGTLVDTE